jgi:PD-(D/E)XK nuclease superfamily
MRRRRGGVTAVTDIGVPPDFNLVEPGISQSLFTVYMRCRQAFLFAVNRWVKDKGGRTTGFGSICHEMLDRIYSMFMAKHRLPSGRTLDRWLDEYVEEHRDELRGKSETELERDKVVIRVLLTEYMEYYERDWVDKDWVALEELFAEEYKVPNGVIALMRGKKDGRYRTNGKIWLMETKTMGRIEEEKLLARLDLNFQNLYYVTADELQHGEPVRGTLYNVVRNPGHKVGTDTLPQFAARLREIVRKNPEHFFMRYEIPYTERDKEVFKQNLRWWFEECESFLAGAVPLTRNYMSCDHKYPCDYLSACTSGKMAGYTQRPSLFPELAATPTKEAIHGQSAT